MVVPAGWNTAQLLSFCLLLDSSAVYSKIVIFGILYSTCGYLVDAITLLDPDKRGSEPLGAQVRRKEVRALLGSNNEKFFMFIWKYLHLKNNTSSRTRIMAQWSISGCRPKVLIRTEWLCSPDEMDVERLLYNWELFHFRPWLIYKIRQLIRMFLGDRIVLCRQTLACASMRAGIERYAYLECVRLVYSEYGIAGPGIRGSYTTPEADCPLKFGYYRWIWPGSGSALRHDVVHCVQSD